MAFEPGLDAMKVSPDRLSTLLGPWAAGMGPLYERLARALAAAIDRGELGADDILPTERDLARRLEVSRTTVVGAYGELKDAGRLDSRQGRGTWVRASDAPGSGAERAFSAELYGGLLRQDDGMIELTAACPPPTSLVSRTVAEMSGETLAQEVYGAGYLPAGLPELRGAVAEMMTAEGLPSRAEEILITTGAHQAICLVTTLLGEPGSPVLTEEVTYPGALDVARGAGMRPIGVPLDERGVVPEALEDLLERVRPRFVYLVPAHQNPTGSVLSERRSRIVAELAARSRVPVVEDLALRRLLMDDRPLPAPIGAHAPDAVITIGSVSKVLWGGLRIGWIRAARPVVERLTRLKITADMGTGVLSQHIAAALLPHIEEATEERRQDLITGYEALSDALSEQLPEWTWDPPRGGCTLWVRLPGGDARAFGQVAQRCGVNVVPGQVLSAEGGHGDRLRLPFVHEPAVIAEAVRRMAVAWELYAGRDSRVDRAESLIV
jgi:DNA-binding transcriptional MocR family regulator